MTEVVQTLKREFPHAELESTMYLCRVERHTRTPFLYPDQYASGINYLKQFVPSIKCSDCPEDILLIESPDALGPARRHFLSDLHFRRANRGRLLRSGMAERASLMLAECPDQEVHNVISLLPHDRLSISWLDNALYRYRKETLLMLAVKNYEMSIVQCLLKENTSINAVDDFQQSALHMACCDGHYEKAELLIRYGLRLHDRDREYRSALHLAVRGGGIDCGLRLVDVELEMHRANSPNPSDTILGIACRCGEVNVVRRILEGQAVDDDCMNKALEIALSWAPYEVVQLLLEAKIPTDRRFWHDMLLLRNSRDDPQEQSTRNGKQPFYPDAAAKLLLFKDYGFDVDRMASLPQPEDKTIQSNQPNIGDPKITEYLSLIEGMILL